MAYDLKKVPKEMVMQRMERTGEPLDIVYINKNGYSMFGWIKTVFLFGFLLWVNLFLRVMNYCIIDF